MAVYKNNYSWKVLILCACKDFSNMTSLVTEVIIQACDLQEYYIILYNTLSIIMRFLKTTGLDQCFLSFLVRDPLLSLKISKGPPPEESVCVKKHPGLI